MEIEYNKIKLVKALVKITSAITDIDELKDQAQYKFQLKRDLNAWQIWIEEFTADPLIKLTKASDTIFIDLIEMYNDFENRFNVKDEYTTRILLFLGKIHSSMRDIDEMKVPYNDYIGQLRAKLQFISSQSYLNVFISNNTEEFNNLLGSMNKLSDEKIIGSD